jgi:hypothetical protein
MRLSEEDKQLFLTHQDKPIVGLIHKVTKAIVLGPCIPQKVCLILNAEGEAISGVFMGDNSSTRNDINPVQLTQFNEMLREGFLPRLAYVSTFTEKSSHEFLFDRKCPDSKKSDWGGFALNVNASGELEYQFVSGAFNSPKGPKGSRGPRIKGALLSEDLAEEVRRQTAELMPETVRPAAIAAPIDVSPSTPPRKRHCPEVENRPCASNLGLFSHSAFAKERLKDCTISNMLRDF